MNVSTRNATKADAETACTILRRSITECCVEDHRNNPELLSGWLQNKTPENVSTWFTSGENFSVVAVSSEELVGVGLLTKDGNLALCYALPEVVLQVSEKRYFAQWSLTQHEQGLTKFT